MVTNSVDFGYERGFSKRGRTKLKIAVQAATPRASVEAGSRLRWIVNM
jgi:hypothetical protein